MKRELILCLMTVVLLAACNTSKFIHQKTPTIEITQTASIPPNETIVGITLPTLPLKMTETPSPSPLPIIVPTIKSIATRSIARAPMIHARPGSVYETLFRIPVGEGSGLRYIIPSCCADIEGPNAIAVLSDNTFLISDLIGRRLLNYDQAGHVLRTIKLDDLGIGYVRDLRVKGNVIYLLETSYQKYRLHRLTLAGELLATEDIPYKFLVDKTDTNNTLESTLTGITIDCEERVILEVAGGFKLFPLTEVRKQSDSGLISEGLLCNDKHFLVSTPKQKSNAQVTAGDMIYQTRLTQGIGGLNFLDVFKDGSIYLIRDDVLPASKVIVDQTVHYIGEDGTVQSVARVPLSEFYYPITRNVAVSPSGEVFSLLPRSDSLDVIRLNFYQGLEPLISGAVDPQVTQLPSKP